MNYILIDAQLTGCTVPMPTEAYCKTRVPG